MNRKAKRILSIVLIGAILMAVTVFTISRLDIARSHKYVVSNFISYDLTRAVIGDGTDIKMLLKPGSELHSFEPTSEDIVEMINADLIVYVGGESEEWMESVLKNNHVDEKKVVRLMDYVDTLKELSDEGKESDGEDDEHIWTNPNNVIKLVNAIEHKMSEIDSGLSETYRRNAKSYNDKFMEIDKKIRMVVSDSDKKTLIFGDRFPFQYLVREYGLDYYAAYLGCSEQTEVSSKKIKSLIDEVNDNHIGVVLKIELTSDKIAKTIAEATGAEVLVLNSAHNISEEDYNSGVTYADIMEDNIEVLEKALQ